MYEDTITAIATPLGEGGIGTIRLSGPQSLAILRRLFRKPNGKALAAATSPPSHKLMFGKVIDPVSGDTVDEVLVAFMAGPNSYTREDVVDIDCHGGPAPLQRILGLTLRAGARLANPGEFTLRAFLHGRLDLAQAEAVLDVIQSRTSAGLRAAVDQLGGRLSENVHVLRGKLLRVLAHLDAEIDFPEEDVPTADVSPDLLPILNDLRLLAASAESGVIMRQGVRTALIGRPNVGKSSLLNALLRTERAIVTPIPGTTRDTLEEAANIGGIPFVLVDTAGITETLDVVEQIGVERSKAAAGRADLLLLVLDQSAPLSDGDKAVIAEIQSVQRQSEEALLKRLLVVLNKSDLPAQLDPQAIEQLLPGVPLVHAAAREDSGTQELEQAMTRQVLGGKATSSDTPLITNVRHQEAIERAASLVSSALQGAQSHLPAAFIAVDLHAALNALGEITGETVGEDLLDVIFREFCIGK